MKQPKVNKALNRPKKPLRVGIGIPSGDMVHADFAMSLAFLTVHSILSNIQLIFINQKSSLVEVGRNLIVDAAKSVKVDKLLFLDSDMTFPDTLLVDLLKTKADVVCCDAAMRRPPYDTVIRDINNNRINHANETKDVVEVMGASLACALIDMKVFDKVKAPYFVTSWPQPDQFLGEDYNFGNKVRDAGFRIWCDINTSKKIGHIGCITLYPDKVSESAKRVKEKQESETKEI